MIALIFLALGLIVYTSCVCVCCNIERDYQWRKWIEDFRSGFGPDDRNRYGIHRREIAKENRRRTAEDEREGGR